MNGRLNKFNNLMDLREMMELAGVIGDPYFEDRWLWANSPLNNGQTAARFQQQLYNALLPRVLAKQVCGSSAPTWPAVDPTCGLLLGTEFLRGLPVALCAETLNRHVLIIGATGTGKTTCIFRLIAQLLRNANIGVSFQDHKGEGRRLQNIFPDEVAVFRPDQEPCNRLEPVGHAESHAWGIMSEVGKARNLHVETWPELVEVLLRIQRGLKHDEPHPSLKDFECVLRHLAHAENRPKLETAAGALASLSSVLGQTARIRRPASLDPRFRIVVYEHQGLPPRIHGFLAAVRLQRAQMGAVADGRANQDLRHVYVSDEGTMEFGKELSQAAGSGYVSPHKRGITQLRSAGVGFLVGVQNVSEIDESLKSNVATIICLRCPNPKDAREAAQMLGLPTEIAPELQNLPVGVAYVRSEGFTAPVKVRIPNFDLGSYPSDDEVQRRMAPVMARLEAETVFSPVRTEQAPPLDYAEILGERAETPPATAPSSDAIRQRFFAEHRALLDEIVRHPEACITEHYSNLGWSAGRGTRVKTQLLEMGLIFSGRQRDRNGRPREILVVTETGKEFLNENDD
jgi:hypothetical protein